ALAMQHIAKLAMGADQIRLLANRFTEADRRLVELTLLGEGRAQVEVQRRRALAGAKGFAKAARCLVEPAQRLVDLAQALPALGERWVFQDQFPIDLGRLGEVARLLIFEAESQCFSRSCHEMGFPILDWRCSIATAPHAQDGTRRLFSILTAGLLVACP